MATRNELALTPDDLAVLLGAARFVTATVGNLDMIVAGLRVETARKQLVGAASKLEGLLAMIEEQGRKRAAAEAEAPKAPAPVPPAPPAPMKSVKGGKGSKVVTHPPTSKAV